MAERVAAGLLLLAQLAAIGWFIKGDLTRWRAFRGLADSAGRTRRYWRWCVKDLLAFALPPLVGMMLLGRLDALMIVPKAFVDARALLPRLGPNALRDIGLSAAAGFAGGTALVVLAGRLRRSRKPFGTLGRVDAVLPRSPRELGAAAMLSLSAGVTEELAFRLFLPLTLALATGSAVLAFGLAALIFGAMHRYQGWVGVIVTTLLGGALTALYLATGLLWLVMAAHVVIDLNGLVLRPLLTGQWREGRAAR